MTKSLLCLGGKPCSTGTHNQGEIVYNSENAEGFSAIFCNHQWNHYGITVSNLNPMGAFSIFQSNRNFYHSFTVTTVIHKSRNLIGTGGIAKFGPK